MNGLLDKINHALEACRRLDENLWSIDAARWAERINPDLVEEILLHIEALELEIMHHEAVQERLKKALLRAARSAEDLKQECSGPESYQAARNTQYMSISYAAREAIKREEPFNE